MSDKLPQAGAASSTSAAPQVPTGSIRVIGAGLGRTGTTSLQAGLKKLGFKPYHMRDVTSSDGHLKLWTQYMLAWKAAAAAGPIGGPLQEAREADKTTAADAVIDRIVSDGFTATTDYPACLIYERLMARFPNALVLLGIRTTGKAWADSVMNTIGQAGPSLSVTPWTFIPTLREFAPITSWVFAATNDAIKVDPITNSITSTPGEMAHAHDEWAKHVHATVPADRLLVHKSADGWDPICKALKLEVPGGDYPHLNDSKELAATFRRLQLVSKLWWPAVALVIAAAATYLKR